MSDNTIKNIGIKVSGDLLSRENVYDFARDKAIKHHVVAIIEGDTDINNALIKAGYEPAFDKDGRRITETEEERNIIRQTLQSNTIFAQNRFLGTGVIAKPSFLDYAEVLCLTNGDDFITTVMYIGYDELYVLTDPSKIKDEQKKFKDYPKIKIIPISETAKDIAKRKNCPNWQSNFTTKDFAQEKNCTVWQLTFDDGTTESIAVESCVWPLSETEGWLVKDDIVTDTFLDLEDPNFSYEKYFGKKVVAQTQLYT